MRAQVETHIDAPPERVWRMVSEVTRMGEWSPITYRCEWLEGSTGPEVGARFKGYNRLPPARWWTICEVTDSQPGKVFEFRTVKVSFPFSIGTGEREMTRWHYDFEPDGIGTRVRESYEVAFVPPLLAIPERIARLLPGGGRMVDRRRARTEQGMRETLRRIKAAAEGPA